MISLRFGTDDVARVRFAISPLFELWQSVRALQKAEPLHLPWLASTRERVDDLDLTVLLALQPPRGYNPDFIHPPPSGPVADLDDELEQLLSTPADQVRLELSQVFDSKPLPVVLEPFIADPHAAVSDLVDLLRKYWGRALAPHWERMRALLDGDILYRARQIADGGPQALFADVDPSMHYAGAELRLDKPWSTKMDLNGRGLLLVPSVFICTVAIIDELPWQPSIIYPARGTALLWEPAPSAPDALAALLGARRAAILTSLDAPKSTTELARWLGIPPGGVSQHLAVLKEAGLVRRHRVGRVVLYGRSPVGELLAKG